MKIRIISDLHIDINQKYPLDLHQDNASNVYTIVAGDVCNEPNAAVTWLKKNVHQGMFVSGNHDVYNTKLTIEEVKELFHREFPPNGNVVYFDNDIGVVSKEIDDGILLVGDVMYTDYKLSIEWRNVSGDQSKNMFLADPGRRSGGMNDFNFGTCKKMYPTFNDWKTHFIKRDDVWRLVPQWYLEHHEKAFKRIAEIVEANKDKQVVLVTHHGLSPRCLDSQYSYENGSIDASYASDKEEWIMAHPNIKCIISGHVHCRKQFKVGDCLYVMNALGYCGEQYKQFDREKNEYVAWTPDCFLDTETWTAEWHHVHNAIWEEQKSKEDEFFKKYAHLFI